MALHVHVRSAASFVLDRTQLARARARLERVAALATLAVLAACTHGGGGGGAAAAASITPDDPILRAGEMVTFTVHHAGGHTFVWTASHADIDLLEDHGQSIRVAAQRETSRVFTLRARSETDPTVEATTTIRVEDAGYDARALIEIPGENNATSVLGADLAVAGDTLVVGHTLENVHTLLAKHPRTGLATFRETETGLAEDEQSILLALAAAEDAATGELTAVYAVLQPPVGNAKLLKLDADLQPVTSGWSPPDLNYRRGLVVDGGVLHAVHGVALRSLVRLGESGARVGEDVPLPASSFDVSALFVDLDGRLHVAFGRKIVRLTDTFELDTAFEEIVPSEGSIRDAWMDGGGRILVCVQLEDEEEPFPVGELVAYNAAGSHAWTEQSYRVLDPGQGFESAAIQRPRAVAADRDGTWWLYDRSWSDASAPAPTARVLIAVVDEPPAEPDLAITPRSALLGPGWERRFEVVHGHGAVSHVTWEFGGGEIEPDSLDAVWLRAGSDAGTWELLASIVEDDETVLDGVPVIVRDPALVVREAFDTPGSDASQVVAAAAPGSGLFYFVGYLSSGGEDCIARVRWESFDLPLCEPSGYGFVLDAFDAGDGMGIANLALGPDEHVYWVRRTSSGSELFRASSAGESVSFALPSDFQFQGAIAVGPGVDAEHASAVYLVEELGGSFVLWRFDLEVDLPSGSPLDRPSIPHVIFGAEAPVDIALDPHLRLLYVTPSEHRVCRVLPHGEFDTCIPETPFGDPITRVAASGNGIVHVVTTDGAGESTIHWMDSDGVVRETLAEYVESGGSQPTPFGRILAIAGAPDGRTRVIDDADGSGGTFAARILRIDPD